MANELSTPDAGPEIICRNAEQFGDGSAAVFLLRTNRPTWYLANELPWLGRAKLEEYIQAGFDMWTVVCDVKATRAASTDAAQKAAQFRFEVAQIDGAGGVLADMQLPHPQLFQQRCRLDVAEQALEEWFPTIFGHEDGHGFALQHWDAAPPPELMEARLNKQVRTPQAAEAALMRTWYGEPIPVVKPDTPTQLPSGLLVYQTKIDLMPGDLAKVAVEVQCGGKKATLSGEKKLA